MFPALCQTLNKAQVDTEYYAEIVIHKIYLLLTLTLKLALIDCESNCESEHSRSNKVLLYRNSNWWCFIPLNIEII